MRNYPPEVKADAVALYESRPDATVRLVTADLGIISETLRIWGEGCGGKPSSGGAGRRNRLRRRPRWRR